jgi:hypothetical protein
MGLEAITNPPIATGNEHISEPGAVKASVAVLPPVPADADLRLICDAWPTLPDAIKAGIIAMINASSGAKNGAR